ncbi:MULTISPECIES: hypothetical protein [unclassified Bacillus (in: firmicutes)]|nr:MULTISPECIES: hypothetical protein [unclassified Bacillus (in: firmicutes)]
MTLDEIMWKLAELGSEQTKNTFINHGVQGKQPFMKKKTGSAM